MRYTSRPSVSRPGTGMIGVKGERCALCKGSKRVPVEVSVRYVEALHRYA